MLADLFFLVFLSSFFVGLYLWSYLVLIFQMPKDSCSNVFAFTSMVFFIILFQKLDFRLQVSN